jgi:putative flippase GtrA
MSKNKRLFTWPLRARNLEDTKVIDTGLKLLRECCELSPSKKPLIQFIRSLVVSIVALIVDFGSMVAFKELLGINYLLAATLSFTLGVIVNYVLSIWWVFADRKLSSRRAEFTIFVIICAIGLILNLGIIAGTVQLLNVDYRIAKIISTIVVFFWNFLARKKILY